MQNDPSPAVEAERSNFLLRVTVATVVDHETAEVVNALRTEGIRSILLKGPAIAEWLYDDAFDRLYGDADLLVDPARLEDARALVQRLGFTGGDLEVSTYVPRTYAETWTREATVELHRTLSGIAAPPEVAWSELARNTDRMEVGGAEVEVLPGVGKALVVALHAAHHGAAVEPPLRDLRRAVERVPVDIWREAGALAERLDAAAAFGAGLRLVDGGSELADRIGAGRSRSVEAELRAASAPNMAVLLTWLAHGQAAPRHKLVVMIRKLFPPLDWMRAASPLARRGRLGVAAAYAVRPITLLRRLPRAIGALRRARRAVSDD